MFLRKEIVNSVFLSLRRTSFTFLDYFQCLKTGNNRNRNTAYFRSIGCTQEQFWTKENRGFYLTLVYSTSCHMRIFWIYSLKMAVLHNFLVTTKLLSRHLLNSEYVKRVWISRPFIQQQYQTEENKRCYLVIKDENMQILCAISNTFKPLIFLMTPKTLFSFFYLPSPYHLIYTPTAVESQFTSK